MTVSVDPDLGPDERRLEWDVVAAVALGGVAGAEARYALGLLDRHSAQQFPWMTLVINAVGCLLIGALLAALSRAERPPRLTRPLLGTGVLGGFTTFSTFSVDVVVLVDNECWGRAIAYVFATVTACLLGVVAGAALVRR
nr:fluoride efflux transporter CrcB [uncultured bacterium]